MNFYIQSHLTMNLLSFNCSFMSAALKQADPINNSALALCPSHGPMAAMVRAPQRHGWGGIAAAARLWRMLINHQVHLITLSVAALRNESVEL
jgi:hypothetical protein